ncbi:MAG: glycosyltransferase family 1 protein [Oligoflexia bacterium]|nr:glycosyltransferase family 1 protein [Oligoflexia bacterium]
MKKIHFLVDVDPLTNYLTAPLYFVRHWLRRREYDINFFYTPKTSCFECDILLLNSRTVFNLFNENHAIIQETSPVIDLLKKIRKYTNKIIWMDSTDSTGTNHFELLPYVNLYLKKQLLKDKFLYQKHFYGNRIFSDFYHQNFGIIDSNPAERSFPLDPSDHHKVDLSWNLGLGDLHNTFSAFYKFRRLLPSVIPVNYKIDFVSPYTPRKNDIFLRVSTDWKRESVVFHRKELIKILNRFIQKHKGITGSVQGYLPPKRYLKEINQSKISFGPFGWGEICIREFEAFINGSLLLRTDISCIRTWPSIFEDKKTCVFYRWDFEDLEEKILFYLENEKLRLEISENGQHAYKTIVSTKGMENFCDWFIAQIEK